MLRPRFESVRLRYGCHDGEWTFPEMDRPVVVLGPNGSGKSTLVEGLVRTLFGFDRRRGEDAGELEARRPWGQADDMHGIVVLARNGDRFEITRNFATDQVRVYSLLEGTERFIGDGNPAARNQQARHYRQVLMDLLGLRDMDSYRRTLLIRQGELPALALGDHLLRIAAGGHTRVAAARREIAEAHRAITRRPLHAGAAGAINPREMEKLDDEIDSVRSRLEEARAAGKRRTPLALDRDRIAEKLATMDSEIELLESALSALARTDAAELNARRLRQHIQRLGEAADSVSRAAGELDAARAARRLSVSEGTYPDDFPERLARAEVRWNDLDEIRRVPAPWLGVAGLVGLAGGGVLFAYGLTLWAAMVGGLGLLLGASWAVLALWEGRRRIAARREVRKLLHGIPGAGSLGPGTKGRALARFRKQQDASRRLERARDDLAEALRDARTLLQEDGIGPAPDGEGEEKDPSEPRRAGRLVARLDAAAEAAREQLARGRVELERIGDLSLSLPDDVAPTESSVTEALRQRRSERGQVQESMRNINQELLERGTPGESVEALEDLLASLESRREALGLKAEVLEAAHSLILDAYDSFRDRDQERLARQVSTHVERLGEGRLEGIEVSGSLDEARVRTQGRLVPLSTPPLSFGEFHALQLGVRLGAADFLAGIGILPPLIIDEPFAHLDGGRASAVWRLLEEVATGRQVLVTTQDARLLDDLEIPPDIGLGR